MAGGSWRKEEICQTKAMDMIEMVGLKAET